MQYQTWIVRYVAVVLLSIALVSGPALSALAAQDVRDVSAVQQKENSAGSNPLTVKQKKIDEAGKNIGIGIDKIGQKAGHLFGNWINAKAVFDITWFKLLICLFLIVIVVAVEKVVKLYLEKEEKAMDEAHPESNVKKIVLKSITKPVLMIIWIYGLYVAISPLFEHFAMADGTNPVQAIFQKAIDIGTIVALFWFILRILKILDMKLAHAAAGDASSINRMLIPILGRSIRIFIFLIGAIIVIQNLTGVKIGPLLASLGIGGLAIALAAKDTIANFFGTLTILFDQPFQVGQRVVIDNTDGIIEDVGFRSTRIRTLSGHLVTIPNEKLVNQAVENIGQRPYIKWLTNITIAFDTPAQKVEQAVEIIQNIVDNHEGMHADLPPRVYFNGFNDWSLNIMVLVWYHPPNYWDFQAWVQRTCLAILRAFENEGIDFAFPSKTIYLANDDKRQLKLEMLKGDMISGAEAK